MNSSTSPHQHSPFPSFSEMQQQQMSPGNNQQQQMLPSGNGTNQQQQMMSGGPNQLGGPISQQQMLPGGNQQHMQQMFQQQFQQHGQMAAQQLAQGYANGAPTPVSVMGKSCGGCGYRIEERFLLLALDRYWHHGCLKCTYCQATLADLGASCFSKSGMILCKRDYHRMFAGTNGASSGGGAMGANNGPCSACGQAIPASELVMRAPVGGSVANGAVFHLACFVCSKCGGHLKQGDRYYMLGCNLVCEQDWQKLVKSSSSTSASVRKGKVGRPRRSRD